MPDADRRRPLLNYQPPPPRKQPSALAAILLCTPGLLCWAMILAGRFAEQTSAVVREWYPDVFMAMWATAVATALWSIVLYGRHPREPKPWYVLLCLASNILGLLFSVLIIAATL